MKRYEECFATKTGNCSKKASEYLRGLIQSNKGNMSAMAEVIPDTNSQSLQHFISYSPFDEEELKRKFINSGESFSITTCLSSDLEEKVIPF